MRARFAIAWLALLLLPGCAAVFALTVAQQPAPAPPAPVGSAAVYKQAAGHDLHLYLLSPTGPSAHSAIVFFHGGAWTMGESSQFNQQASYLASRGMLAIEVDYRLLPKDSTDSPRICVEDAKSAMRWVRAHAASLGIDPGKIVVAGGSAGGYLAAFSTMLPGWDAPTDDLSVSSRGDAMVLFNPVLDVGPDGFGNRRFGPGYAAYSPADHVTSAVPPTLIQSGGADKLVPPASLEHFQAEAKRQGARCELVLYPGQPHSFFTPEPYTTQSLAVAARFLDSLGLLLPGPPPTQRTGQPVTGASAQPAASFTTISISTRQPLSLPSRAHFAGINFQLFLTGSGYLDPALQRMTAELAPGWLRFPGGTVDDVYDWRTGELVPASIARFEGTRGAAHGEMLHDREILTGKGPLMLADYTRFVDSQPQHPHTIAVVNTFTDTPESAAALVAEARRKGLAVDLWELGNEPFYFPSFYADSTAYLRAVEPYARAVRQADPAARVAVYLQRNEPWIDGLAHYPHPFWDELYWHPYPTRANVTEAEQLSFYNGFLRDLSNPYLDTTLARLFGPDYKIEISEFNIGALRGGAFAAVFVAEYLMRLSADPHVTHAGMHMLTGTADTLDAAILPREDHVAEAIVAGKSGHPVSLANADFGYYLTPYGLALELADPAINGSTALLPTAITGGPQLPAVGQGQSTETTSALYAQAYLHPGGETVLLVTNKSAVPQTVLVTADGEPIAAQLAISAFGAADPATRNTAAAPQQLSLTKTTVTGGPVTLPPYGVASIGWHSAP